MCLKKARQVVCNTYTLFGFDDDSPAKLFDAWVTVKKIKAKTLAQAKTLGREVAKKEGWNVWKVKKTN